MSPPERPIHPRRTPEQSRSRARVAALLDAAAELLRHQGIDQLTVTAIAQHAGMSKAALYRYYPNKAAVIRALAQREFAQQRAGLQALSERTEPPRVILAQTLVAYLNAHREDPFRAQLRAAIRADPELSALDLDDSRENAKILTALLVSRGIDPAGGRLATRILLILELIDGVIRLISVLDAAQTERIINEFVEMALGSLETNPD